MCVSQHPSLPHTGAMRHVCCSTPTIHPGVRTTTPSYNPHLAWYQHGAALSRGSEDSIIPTALNFRECIFFWVCGGHVVQEPKQLTKGLFRRKLCSKRASGRCRLAFRGLSWVIVGLWVHISHLYSGFQPLLLALAGWRCWGFTGARLSPR